MQLHLLMSQGHRGPSVEAGVVATPSDAEFELGRLEGDPGGPPPPPRPPRNASVPRRRPFGAARVTARGGNSCTAPGNKPIWQAFTMQSCSFESTVKGDYATLKRQSGPSLTASPPPRRPPPAQSTAATRRARAQTGRGPRRTAPARQGCRTPPSGSPCGSRRA